MKRFSRESGNGQTDGQTLPSTLSPSFAGDNDLKDTQHYYSAGQKFRTFNVMNFLWRRLTLNMVEYENINSSTVAFYLDEISSLLEKQCWIE